jgi:hypothetical protein
MGWFLSMQYRTGTRISKLIIVANSNGELSILRPSIINPVTVINAKDTKVSIISSPPEAFRFLLLLIINSNLSLLKTIFEFLFTSQILPAIVNQDKIIIPVAKASPTPENMIRKNIRFQKLSLFILALMKPTLGFLGLSKIPPYLLVTGLVFLVISKWLKSLGNDVKSSISIYRSCWFKTYNLIIPKLASSFKGIVMVIMALSLCFPWNGAYATEAELSSINELTEYIKLVEKDNSIPRGLLLAIAKTESNVNPYAINVNGKAVVASSMQEAVLVAKRALARGITNVDIGVMQVNYRWHKERFRSIEKMLDPKINIQYAGNLLLSLFRQHGTWYKAISYYHSANHEHHRKYSKKVVTAWVVGRKLN